MQKIYKQLDGAGYRVKHWLLKGQYMGVPQTRHRVFFIALRKDFDFDLETLDMSFNYEPIPYGEIKEGEGSPIKKDTQVYRMLCQATPDDLRISDIFVRLGQKEK